MKDKETRALVEKMVTPFMKLLQAVIVMGLRAYDQDEDKPALTPALIDKLLHDLAVTVSGVTDRWAFPVLFTDEQKETCRERADVIVNKFLDTTGHLSNDDQVRDYIVDFVEFITKEKKK